MNEVTQGTVAQVNEPFDIPAELLRKKAVEDKKVNDQEVKKLAETTPRAM